MRIVREQDRKAGDGPTETDEEFGFWYPFELVQTLYWQTQKGGNPSVGGWLEQDERLAHDLGTYGWIASMCWNQIAKEKTEAQRAQEAAQGRR